MTLRRLLLALAFASVFFIGLIAFAPASLMGYALERAPAARCRWCKPGVASGTARALALLRQNSRYQSLGSYRWQLQMFSASLQVQAGEAAPMTVRYVPFAGRINVDNLHISLPASIIGSIAPPLGPYQLQGSLEASSDHLTLDASGHAWPDHGGLAECRFRAFRNTSAGRLSHLAAKQRQALDAQLSTLSGKLKLSGKGSFDNVSGMRFNGTAQAAPGIAATELNELLHHIGPEVSPGVFALALMPQPVRCTLIQNPPLTARIVPEMECSISPGMIYLRI